MFNIACNCSAVQRISAFLRPCFHFLKKFPLKKNRKPPKKNILGPFRIGVAHRAPRLCTAVAERAIEDTFTGFRKRRARGIVGLHIQHGFETCGGWMWRSIQRKHKKCVELGVMAFRKSRRGGRKGGEGSLHVSKIAEPGIAYCTVCDRIIDYTNRGKTAHRWLI